MKVYLKNLSSNLILIIPMLLLSLLDLSSSIFLHLFIV